jgi:enterochelin esterase-like enzyme
MRSIFVFAVATILLTTQVFCQDAKTKARDSTTQVGQEAPEKPFKIVDRSWTIESILADLKKANALARADGDVLTFFRRSSADSVMVVGSIQAPMRRVDNSDYWTLSVKIPSLSKAVIGYSFLEGQSRSLVDHDDWRGVEAPAAVTELSKLKGKVLTEKLWMDGLEEHRGVSVYLPPKHDAKEEQAVIYMGDGDAVESYARMIEPLIESGEIPRTLIVGVLAGDYRGDRNRPHQMELDYRAIEYLAGAEEMLEEKLVHQGHFRDHEKFFTQTVRDWAEREHGASRNRSLRGVFGVSNSAAFAVTMAHRHPDLYGFILPFSFPWIKAAEQPQWDPDEAPRHYFVAGLLEPSVHKTTKDYADQLKSAGYPVVFKERVSGHDALMWREEFVHAVRWALGDK